MRAKRKKKNPVSLNVAVPSADLCNNENVSLEVRTCGRSVSILPFTVSIQTLILAKYPWFWGCGSRSPVARALKGSDPQMV